MLNITKNLYRDAVGSGQWRSSNDDPSYAPPGQIVINGSGFGTKSAQPAIWTDFSGGSVGQLVKDFDPLWVAYQASLGAVISDLDARFPGHKAAYSDPSRGGDFLTNHHAFPQTLTAFVSYYARVHAYRGAGHMGGVTKFCRVNSTSAAGGGGVYTGVGTTTLGGTVPPEWYLGWTGSGDSTNNQVYLNQGWYPLNAWRRIEYEIKLNTVDVADGFETASVFGYGRVELNNCMQRKTGYPLPNFLHDSTLLGLEAPNQWQYWKPNVLLANTDYTITVSGTPYTYSKPTTPTIAEILEGLRLLVVAGGHTARVWNNEEINVNGFNEPTYSSNFTRMPPYGVSQAEVFVDTDPEFKRIYIGDADTVSACDELNPMVSATWGNTQVVGAMPPFASSGTRYAYKQLTPKTIPVFVGELVSDGNGGWEVNE